MSRHESSSPPIARRARLAFVAVLLSVAVLAGSTGCESLPASVSPSGSSTGSPILAESVRQRPHLPPRGATAFDERSPEVARLDAALLAALTAGAEDAADDGVALHLTSGWRSREHQERLFAQAVADHGSEAAAAEWVARPGTSVHETGGAVDIGPEAATDWLSRHGATYGLCRVYDNEPWHYELRPDAVEDGCPATYADPSEDPRMQ